MNFNDMIKSGYFPFMAEAGGYDNLVNTREARVNAAMKEFEGALRRGYVDVTDEFRTAIRNHNLTEADLTGLDRARFQAIANKY